MSRRPWPGLVQAAILIAAVLALRTRQAIEAERAARARADELLLQTQRLRTRAEANESRVATIVEHLPCGVMIVDAVGKVVMVNEAVGRIAGAVPSGLLPLTEQPHSFDLRDPDTDAPFGPGGGPIERALAGQVVDAQEALFRRPGESVDRRAQLSAAPMRDRQGGLRGAVIVMTDVTELHRAISERGRLDGAVQTARLITHELNNKLTAVLVNADLVASEVDGDVRQLVEEITLNAEAAAEIVTRLNRLVRFEETDVGLGEPVLDLNAATTS